MHDDVKIEIKGFSVKQVMEQMAQAGKQCGAAVQGEWVPKAVMEQLIGKLTEVADRVGALLQQVDVLDGDQDVKSKDPYDDMRHEISGRSKERGGTATTPCDVSDPPFQHARKELRDDVDLEALMEAVREGGLGDASSLDHDLLEVFLTRVTEQDDRMEAQGRAIDDLAKRVFDLSRDILDEAGRMEGKVKKCDHVPVLFEYVTYEYDNDGNRKEVSRSDQFLMGWTSFQGDKPTFGYFYDDKPIKDSIKVMLCFKCEQLFVVVDGVVM